MLFDPLKDPLSDLLALIDKIVVRFDALDVTDRNQIVVASMDALLASDIETPFRRLLVALGLGVTRCEKVPGTALMLCIQMGVLELHSRLTPSETRSLDDLVVAASRQGDDLASIPATLRAAVSALRQSRADARVVDLAGWRAMNRPVLAEA